MAPGTTPPAPSRSAEEWSRFRFLFVCGLVVVALANLSAQPPRAPLRIVPVRLHGAAGWGVPAVDRQSVFYLSKDHELIAVERSTGRERWRRRLNTADGHTQGIEVRLANGLVIAGDGDLFAFDAETGRLRWRWPAGELVATGRFLGDVVDRALIVGSASSRVAAIDVATGHTRWQTVVSNDDAMVLPEAAAPSDDRQSEGRQILEDREMTPVRAVSEGGKVYVAYSDFAAQPRRGGVVALDVRSGSWRSTWSFPQRSSVAASAAGRPVRAGSLVFAAATDGHVYGLSASDGPEDEAASRLEWHRGPERLPFLAEPVSDIRALAAAPGRLVISSLSGVLTGCPLAHGGDCWRFSSPADGSNGFGVSVSARRNLVFAPFASGRLGIVSLDAGELVAMVSLPASRFDWPPVSTGGQSFVAAEDGLYELRANDE